MKNQLSVALFLCLPIFLFSQINIPSENNSTPNWYLGFTIGAFNTSLSNNGQKGNIYQSKSISFNYQLDLYRNLSPRFFIETSLGYNNTKRIQEISGSYIYTEENATTVNATTIENQYSAALNSGPINYDIDFKVRTTKFDDEQNFEEGESISLDFSSAHQINHASIPLRINYKFSEKPLSLFLGLGVAANILIEEKIDLESIRQYGLTIGDRYYTPDSYPFGPSQPRNRLSSWEAVPTNSAKSFFLDGMINFGLIHVHHRNTFLLYANHHRSLTSFYGNATLKQVGLKVGWRYSLGKGRDKKK